MRYSLLTLSQTTYFRLFQTERLCRRQFRICWKRQKVLQMGRKHCGKRRNCSLRAISPFPIVFSKDMYCRHVKTRACLGKGVQCICKKCHLGQPITRGIPNRMAFRDTETIRNVNHFAKGLPLRIFCISRVTYPSAVSCGLICTYAIHSSPEIRWFTV